MAFPPLEPRPSEFPPPPDIDPDENPDRDPFQHPPEPDDDPRNPEVIPLPEDLPPPV